jgi:hypothetical protein
MIQEYYILTDAQVNQFNGLKHASKTLKKGTDCIPIYIPNRNEYVLSKDVFTTNDFKQLGKAVDVLIKQLPIKTLDPEAFWQEVEPEVTLRTATTTTRVLRKVKETVLKPIGWFKRFINWCKKKLGIA